MSNQPCLKIYNFDAAAALFGRHKSNAFFELIKDKHTCLQRMGGKTVLTVYEGDELPSDPRIDLVSCLGFSEEKEARWKSYGSLDFFNYIGEYQSKVPAIKEELEEFCNYIKNQCFIAALDIYSSP